MTALFWMFWIVNLVLCVIAIIGGRFANSFRPGGSVKWLAAVLYGCTGMGLVLIFFIKDPHWALGVSALPWVIMGSVRVFEKMAGKFLWYLGG